MVLILISMYIQLNLEDTKAFRELSKQRTVMQVSITKFPVIEAIRKYLNVFVSAALAFLSVQVTFYILIAFMLVYGVSSKYGKR